MPLLAVAKEISLEDVRLGLEKMPDRFYEHPHTVLVVTNLSYIGRAAASCRADPATAAALNWQEVRLLGHDVGVRVRRADRGAGAVLAHGWETKPSPMTGNPTYVRPSVLVLYREDHEFLLDGVIPQPGSARRATTTSSSPRSRGARACRREFKAQKILAPLARSLAPGGRLLTIQSYGRDPGARGRAAALAATRTRSRSTATTCCRR